MIMHFLTNSAHNLQKLGHFQRGETCPECFCSIYISLKQYRIDEVNEDCRSVEAATDQIATVLPDPEQKNM